MYDDGYSCTVVSRKDAMEIIEKLSDIDLASVLKYQCGMIHKEDIDDIEVVEDYTCMPYSGPFHLYKKAV